MVGETNRAPFDLPEAEGELVGGFHTEYSSIKFALFFLAEYINMATVSAMATTLFLGGWAAPWGVEHVWEGANEGYWPLLWFFGKVFFFIFLFIWLRGSLPRFRYDQFMAIGWKILIPGSLAWIVLVATLRLGRNEGWDSQVFFIAGGVVLAVLLAASFVGGGDDDEDEATRTFGATGSDIATTAPTGGFPTPPMPAGGAVRGSAEPLTFPRSSTTVTEEDA